MIIVPSAGGIWLDRGELEKLIEKENEVISHDVHEKDYKYEKKHTHRKKESIFGEIFDMFGD